MSRDEIRKARVSSDLPTEKTETKGGKLSVHTSQGRTGPRGTGQE